MRGYRAEAQAFASRRRALSMQEARDLAARLFDHFDVDPIVVQRVRSPRPGGNGSWFWHPHKGRPAKIHLDVEAPDWIVCHEVAHYVAFERNPREGHGREWAAIYVEAVRVVISEHYADRLHRAMVREGLVPAEVVTYGARAC